MDLKRVLILIPCKNEEETVAVTLRSLLSQQGVNLNIRLLDDGSTDQTAEIVKQIATEHTNLEYIDASTNSGRESGGGIARVVLKGLVDVDLLAFDFVCKFDSDLAFPERYFETILRAFHENDKLGLVGGQCQIQTENGEWIVEKIGNADHIRGALKCYRRAAFEDIDGLVPAIGWDTIDEFKLRFRSWEILRIDDLLVKQFRKTNQATDPKVMARKLGRSLYNMRANRVVVLVSLLKRSRLKHSPLPFRFLWEGYKEAKRSQKPPLVSPEEGRFINTYRMKSYLRKLVPF